MIRYRPRVHFLGTRTPDALQPLYRAAIAAVSPSLCYETFGIVLLEAFREGTPVIARDLGPLPEIVRESGGGLLFSSDDELADAIARLAEDAPLRDKLGRAGCDALRARWVESIVLRDYFALIRKVAERRGRQRVVDVLDRDEAAGEKR